MKLLLASRYFKWYICRYGSVNLYQLVCYLSNVKITINSYYFCRTANKLTVVFISKPVKAFLLMLNYCWLIKYYCYDVDFHFLYSYLYLFSYKYLDRVHFALLQDILWGFYYYMHNLCFLFCLYRIQCWILLLDSVSVRS